MIHIELMLNVFGQEKHEAGNDCYFKIERHGHVHKHTVLDEVLDCSWKSFGEISVNRKLLSRSFNKNAFILLKFPNELSKLLSSTELLGSTHSTHLRSFL